MTIDGDCWGLAGKIKAKVKRDKQIVAKCSIHRRGAESEGETGRESAGAALEATLGLTEIIAVMDWLYSPEHGAPAPAITQQDDFVDLRVRQL